MRHSQDKAPKPETVLAARNSKRRKKVGTADSAPSRSLNTPIPSFSSSCVYCGDPSPRPRASARNQLPFWRPQGTGRFSRRGGGTQRKRMAFVPGLLCVFASSREPRPIPCALSNHGLRAEGADAENIAVTNRTRLGNRDHRHPCHSIPTRRIYPVMSMPPDLGRFIEAEKSCRLRFHTHSHVSVDPPRGRARNGSFFTPSRRGWG